MGVGMLLRLVLGIMLVGSADGGGGYPIDSAWMYGRGSAAAWDAALEQFGAQGGRTVWMFGSSLVRSNVSAIRAASGTKGCLVQGQHCLDVAMANATARGVTVGEVFTYTVDTQLSVAALTPCILESIGELHLPPVEEGGSKSEFWVSVLPRWEKHQGCTMQRGGVVDIVLIDMPNALYTPSPNDELLLLLDATERAGMDAIVPMPALPHLPAPRTWEIDRVAMPAFLGLVKRTSMDLCMRGGKHHSLMGVYQSYESPVSGAWRTISYETYDKVAGIVHSAVAQYCPTIERDDPEPTQRRLQFAISPYWDVTRDIGDNITLEESAAGIAAIAAQPSIDIVAPQEGRGTGKSACYWPHQANVPVADVDPNLARYPHIDGARTFNDQFYASTTQLYHAARREVDKANSQRAVPLQLWMNLEAFESTVLNSCDGDTDRTNKTRVDRSLMFAAGHVDRVVSFMWDPYFTCRPRGYDNVSLSDSIVRDMHRPIMGVATLKPPRTVDVGGWSLCGADASMLVTWETEQLGSAGGVIARMNATVPLTDCVVFDVANGSAITSTGSLLLPFDIGSTRQGSYIGLRPSAAGIVSNAEFAVASPES